MAGMWPAADTEPSVAFDADAAPVERILTHIVSPPVRLRLPRPRTARLGRCSRADAGLGPRRSARARLRVRSAHLLVAGVCYASRWCRRRPAPSRSAAESRPIAPPSARLHRSRRSVSPAAGVDRRIPPPLTSVPEPYLDPQGRLGFPRSGRQGRESWRVKVPLPSIARFGRLAYPLLGEVTNRVLRGRKSHGCPGRVERPARRWERPGWRANPGA